LNYVVPVFPTEKFDVSRQQGARVDAGISPLHRHRLARSSFPFSGKDEPGPYPPKGGAALGAFTFCSLSRKPSGPLFAPLQAIYVRGAIGCGNLPVVFSARQVSMMQRLVLRAGDFHETKLFCADLPNLVSGA